MPKSFLPILILSMICCWIEIDISVPSFPEIAKYFNVKDSDIQLTLAYNFLGFCLSSLIWGPLSDCYGRRKIMVFGNGLLAIGATLCVLASSINALFLARFIQGFGASTSAIVVTVMIMDSYKSDIATKLIGIMNAIATILIAIAPVMGGFINKIVGWRGNYAFVAVISIISWLLIVTMLPETKFNHKRLSIRKILKDYFQLVKSKKFIASSITPSLLYAGSITFTASAPFLYMETFKLSIMEYTLHQAIIISSFAITSILLGRISKIINHFQQVILGIAFTIFGSSLGLIFANSYFLVTIFMIIFSIGFALYYPPIFTSSLEIFPKIKGTASSFIMSLRALILSNLVWTGSLLYNGKPNSIFIIIAIISFLTLGLTCYLLKSPKNILK